jgi:hypothetical protein
VAVAMLLKMLMLVFTILMFYNGGHKGRSIMAAFGGWRLTRTGFLFVIGIIVLGGLVTSGVFLIKNHGEAVRQQQAAKIAEQNLKENSATTQPKDTNTSTQTSTATHANTDTTTATTTTNAAQLPVTGIDPVSTIETAGILAVLAFAAASFLASVRINRQRP